MRKLLYVIMCIFIVLDIAGCSRSETLSREFISDTDINTATDSSSKPVTPSTELSSPPPLQPSTSNTLSIETQIETSIEIQTQNLHKLCKLWGFLKYTHLAFLSGERDWDDELLQLVPIIRFSAESEVNEILSDWYMSLGDDGYDEHNNSYFIIHTRNYAVMSVVDEQQWIAFHDFASETGWIQCVAQTRSSTNGILTVVVDNEHLQVFQNLIDSQIWVESVSPISIGELELRRISDLAWISDKEYLGEQLSFALSRFHEIPIIDRTYAPVFFDAAGRCDFSNEKRFGATVLTTQIEYRLLGLFRLWNVIEYYFPYKDIMDYDWDDKLYEFIPAMIENTDTESYLSSLYALSASTNDAHVRFDNHQQFMTAMFGRRAIPATFEMAGDSVIIRSTIRNRTLQPGDEVLKIDGIDVLDVISSRTQYTAVPNDDKLRWILPYLPLSKETTAEVTVLRDGIELVITVTTVVWRYNDFAYQQYPSVSESHVLLENNIGLINPLMLSANLVYPIMNEFYNTYGIIIDLRQPGAVSSAFLLSEYFLNNIEQYALYTKPFQLIPGLFVDASMGSYTGLGIRWSDAFYVANDDEPPDIIAPYYYDRPVVILIDQVQSSSETAIMILRASPNVTVIGRNTMGANGDIARLCVPGGREMVFSGIGVYTPEGGQTQRIGLVPDIYVERTLEGIRDGRDEIMEEAIEFLLEQ